MMRIEPLAVLKRGMNTALTKLLPDGCWHVVSDAAVMLLNCLEGDNWAVMEDVTLDQ